MYWLGGECQLYLVDPFPSSVRMAWLLKKPESLQTIVVIMEKFGFRFTNATSGYRHDRTIGYHHPKLFAAFINHLLNVTRID